MRHAHTIGDEPLGLATRARRDHLALVECRRENVRLHSLLREQRAELARIVDALEAEVAAALDSVRRLAS